MKVRGPLAWANVGLAFALACSTVFRPYLDGSVLISLFDAVSFFGILTWILIGALWVLDQATHARWDSSQNREAQSLSEVTGDSELGRTPASTSRPAPRATAVISSRLMSGTAIAVLVLSVAEVLRRGIVFGPLITLPCWMSLIGGRLISRLSLGWEVRLGIHLLLSLLIGVLYALALGQIDGITVYLCLYVAVCVAGSVAVAMRNDDAASSGK